MYLSKGYLPTFLTIPGIILVLAGYFLAVLFKFFDYKLLPMGIAFPWLFCFAGLIILGRTKESLDDERVKQIRNFSFRFLSDFLIVAIATNSIIELFGDSSVGTEGFPALLLVILLSHLYYLKVAICFEGINEATGKLRLKYHLLFVPYFTIVTILNIMLFV